jgi:branched-chain amino acid transport system permease protein
MMQILTNGIIAGSIYALVALGFGLIYSTARFFHIAHGAIYTASAYTAYTFSVLLGWHPASGILFGVVAGTALGALMEISVYRVLRRFGSSAVVLLIASLGMLVCIQNAISTVFGDRPRVLRFGEVEEGLLIPGAHITKIQMTIVVVSLLLSTGTWVLLRGSRFGRMLRAVAGDRELASAYGINTDKTILVTFLLGSALASIAGVLIGMDTNLTPAMGFNALLMGIVAAIVGGVGSVPGSFIGGLFIGLAQHLGVWKLPTHWQDAIVFTILILFLLLRPQGFFGKPVRRVTV